MKEYKLKKFFEYTSKKDNFKEELISMIKCEKIKIIIFIILTILFSVFSFLYICCFNIVYVYIRSEWIKSSVLFFIITEVIINFALTFIKSCLRYIAIKFKSNGLFKLSLLLDD